MHEKKRVFKILGTYYNLVKEAEYGNGTKRANSYCIFHSWKSIVLEVRKHGYGTVNRRNYQLSPRSEVIVVLFFLLLHL